MIHLLVRCPLGHEVVLGHCAEFDELFDTLQRLATALGYEEPVTECIHGPGISSNCKVRYRVYNNATIHNQHGYPTQVIYTSQIGD